LSTHQLFHAFKWSAASEIASKAIQPLVFVLLARLLTPEDFGVMTSALMVIGFSQIFWEAGMNKALIQRQTQVDVAANIAFWVNVALGCLIVVILYFTANQIAHTFFQDERVTAVLQVMTLQVLLGSVSAVHIALLQKDMGFKRLFWVRFATVGLPGLASIPLAWNGLGYWALVVGVLVGQVAQVILLWNLSSWRPRLSFDTRIAKEMVGFGAWVGISGLLAWFYVWADSLVVGMYLGSHDLGIFRMGNQFAMMLFAVVVGPIIPVLYSHFTKMNGDKLRLSRSLKKATRIVTLISLPIAFLVFSLSEPISALVFGDKWTGVSLVVAVMVLSNGFSWICSLNNEAYRAQGKPFYETLILAIPIPVYLFVYIWAIKIGFDEFVWARFIISLLVAFMAHQYAAQKLFNIRAISTLTFVALIAILSSVSCLISYLLDDILVGNVQEIFVVSLLSFIIIGGVLLIMKKQLKSSMETNTS